MASIWSRPQWVNAMPFGALTHRISRASVGMVLVAQDRHHILLFQRWFHLLGSSQIQDAIQGVNIYFIILKKIQHVRSFTTKQWLKQCKLMRSLWLMWNLSISWVYFSSPHFVLYPDVYHIHLADFYRYIMLMGMIFHSYCIHFNMIWHFGWMDIPFAFTESNIHYMVWFVLTFLE